MRFSTHMVLLALAAGLAAWATVGRLGDMDSITDSMSAPDESEVEAWFI